MSLTFASIHFLLRRSQQVCLKRRDANLHLMVEKVNLWFDGSFYVLGSQESRSILRRLDRVIGFPEEGALMLRDFEHALFGGTTVKQLLQGLVKNLAKRKGQHQRRKEQNTVLHFHRIVAHFYLVSSNRHQCWYKLQIKLHYGKYWRTNFFTRA